MKLVVVSLLIIFSLSNEWLTNFDAAKDKAMKENRLGLLQKIAELARGVADLSKLEGF